MHILVLQAQNYVRIEEEKYFTDSFVHWSHFLLFIYNSGSCLASIRVKPRDSVLLMVIFLI